MPGLLPQWNGLGTTGQPMCLQGLDTRRVCPSGALISAHIPPVAPTMLSGADKGLGESRGQKRD